MQMRKESTRFSSAFSGGIRYTKVFGNGINVRVGLNYSQINEKFSFSQGNIVQIEYIINAAGDTIGSYQNTFKRFKTSYNQYRTLDIPLTVGYEKNISEKWGFNVSGGVMLNLRSWNSGEVLDRNLQPVTINTTDTASVYQFRNNIGVGGLLTGKIGRAHV